LGEKFHINQKRKQFGGRETRRTSSDILPRSNRWGSFVHKDVLRVVRGESPPSQKPEIRGSNHRWKKEFVREPDHPLEKRDEG